MQKDTEGSREKPKKKKIMFYFFFLQHREEIRPACHVLNETNTHTNTSKNRAVAHTIKNQASASDASFLSSLSCFLPFPPIVGHGCILSYFADRQALWNNSQRVQSFENKPRRWCRFRRSFAASFCKQSPHLRVAPQATAQHRRRSPQAHIPCRVVSTRVQRRGAAPANGAQR